MKCNLQSIRSFFQLLLYKKLGSFSLLIHINGCDVHFITLAERMEKIMRCSHSHCFPSLSLFANKLVSNILVLYKLEFRELWVDIKLQISINCKLPSGENSNGCAEEHRPYITVYHLSNANS